MSGDVNVREKFGESFATTCSPTDADHGFLFAVGCTQVVALQYVAVPCVDTCNTVAMTPGA